LRSLRQQEAAQLAQDALRAYTRPLLPASAPVAAPGTEAVVTASDVLAYCSRTLADWVVQYSLSVSLTPRTVHLAVRMLESALARAHFTKTDMRRLAVACVLIAAKYEELADAVPTLTALRQCCHDAFTAADLCAMELRTLKLFRWRPNFVTMVHYLDTYAHLGVIFTPDTVEGVPADSRIVRFARRYLYFLCEMALDVPEVRAAAPSLAAAAVVAAARRAVRVTPEWRREVEALVGYRRDEVADVVGALYARFAEKYPVEAGVTEQQQQQQQQQQLLARQQQLVAATPTGAPTNGGATQPAAVGLTAPGTVPMTEDGDAAADASAFYARAYPRGTGMG
jgi:hypothetical protein